MEHAITVKEILIFLGVVGGIISVGAVILGLIALMNPFRSGH